LLKKKKKMSIVKNNVLTKGFSGKFGDILFKQIGKKTFAYPVPPSPKKESDKQRSNRDKFREATQFAHAMMADDERKAYYKKLAKKLKLPNAYTAAITDFMRKPEIYWVDTDKYNGKPGDQIYIQASKKEIKVENVNVIVSSNEDQVIEYGAAQRVSADQWIFKSTLTRRQTASSYRVMITAIDVAGQSIDKVVTVKGNISS
jgi:hypothetical protein